MANSSAVRSYPRTQCGLPCGHDICRLQHAMLGTVAAMFEYDWKEAERHFTTALSGEAVPSLVHRYYAHYCLLPVGRAREAVTHHDIAIGDDPLNLTARSERALALWRKYRHQQRYAARHCEVNRKYGVQESSYGPEEMAEMIDVESFEQRTGWGGAMSRRSGMPGN